jgi:hypothetical protein
MWQDGTWDDYLPGEFGPMWNTWRTTRGESGIEPPPEVKKLYELYEARVKYPFITSAKLGNVPIGGQAIAANASLEQMFYK